MNTKLIAALAFARSGAQQNGAAQQKASAPQTANISLPAVTLGFWVIKVLATTLGETGGDAVTMSLNLGYLIGTAIFAAILLVAVSVQIRSSRFHPFLY